MIDRFVTDAELAERVSSATGPMLNLSHDDKIHLTNIATGAYSPLSGFMTETEYKETLTHRKLPSGLDWTIPVLLPVPAPAVDAVRVGSAMALTDEDDAPIATIDVESTFMVDPAAHCEAVFGTRSEDHPGVKDLLTKRRTCIGGTLHVGERGLRKFSFFHTAAEQRQRLGTAGGSSSVAFSTRNMCHLGHEYLHNIALETADVLGINVITGAQVSGSTVPDMVFDTYEFLLENFYPEDRVFLNNMRLPPIYGGPREAFLQATILQNLGFTHFIVGRDHAGIGEFYPKYGSQKIFESLTGLDIEILAISEPRFCKVCDKITTERGCRHSGDDVMALNGRDVRRNLMERKYDRLTSVFRPELCEFIAGLVGANGTSGTGRRIFFD